mmetsp:Transcript_33064/g.51178  ORF Transcript_33064/g.51178 Transcript_33064/m.51178 type:complete len:236 (+) Transcript_33064:608-1315(+)
MSSCEAATHEIMRQRVTASRTTKAFSSSESGRGRATETDVVTDVTLDSDTVRAGGRFRAPNAKAAKRAAFAFSSETITMARSGPSGGNCGGGGSGGGSAGVVTSNASPVSSPPSPSPPAPSTGMSPSSPPKAPNVNRGAGGGRPRKLRGIGRCPGCPIGTSARAAGGGLMRKASERRTGKRHGRLRATKLLIFAGKTATDWITTRWNGLSQLWPNLINNATVLGKIWVIKLFLST